MGAGAILGGLLGIKAHKEQKKAAKAAADAQTRAIEEASKSKAADIVQSTNSRDAETVSLGSSNRKSKRRGKASLTIQRDRPTGGGTGLNIG